MRATVVIIIGFCLGYFASSQWLWNQPASKLDVQTKVQTKGVPAEKAATRQAKSRIKPWSDLQGNSTADYVNNLRGIVCPDETISDIVFCELMREADAKLAPELRMNIPALQARRKQVVQEMQNLALTAPPLKSDYFLSAEQIELANQSLQMYPMSGFDPNAAERRAMLKGFNADQMVYYKSEFERYGPTIARTLAGFRPTQNEYYAMINAMAQNTSEDLLGKLPGILTPDRYQEFLTSQNPINEGVYALCDRSPMLGAKAPQMIELLNLRTNLSTAEFRTKAINLVGVEFFDEYIAIGQ